jgi:hypothetical protein
VGTANVYPTLPTAVAGFESDDQEHRDPRG